MESADGFVKRASDLWSQTIKPGAKEFAGSAMDTVKNGLRSAGDYIKTATPKSVGVDIGQGARATVDAGAAAAQAGKDVGAGIREGFRSVPNPGASTIHVDSAGNARVPPASSWTTSPGATGGFQAIPPEKVPTWTTSPGAAGGGAPPVQPPAAPKAGWWDGAKERMAAQAKLAVEGPTKAAKGLANAGISLGGKVLKSVPYVTQLANIGDTASRVFSPGMSSDDAMTEVKRGGLRMLGTSIGGAAGGVLGSVVPGPGTLAGAAGGAYLGDKIAGWATDLAYGPAKGKGLGDRWNEAMVPPAAAATPAEPQQMNSDGTVFQPTMSGHIPANVPTLPVPTNKTGDVPRQAQTPIRAVPVKPATESFTQPKGGYIKNNETGATYNFSGEDKKAAVPGTKLDRLAKSGPMGAMGAAHVYGALNRMRNNEEGLRTNRLKVAVDLAKYNAEQARHERDFQYNKSKDERDYNARQQQENRERNAKMLDSHLDTEARAAAGEMKSSTLGIGGENDKQYKERIENAKAQRRADYEYSVGRREDGKHLHDLSTPEITQLSDLAKVKDRVYKGREDIWQQASDFLGNKRFDSRNLYSFAPVSAEKVTLPDGRGGYKVNMANGNTVHVADLQNGQFKLLGPNTPVDADMQRMIAPLIQKAKEGKK